jgi:hypothetical protein
VVFQDVATERTHGGEYAVLTAESLAIEEAHIASEYVCSDLSELDSVLATVSATPHYAVVSPGSVDAIDSLPGVREFYAARLTEEFVPLAWRPLTQLVSDWYVFCEGLASRINTQTGEEYQTHSCVIIPTASDGIVGELVWGRPPDAGPEVPTATWRNVKTHAVMVDAVRNGRTRALLDGVIDRTYVCVARDYFGDGLRDAPLLRAEGRDEARAVFERWDAHFGAVEVTVTQKHATSWYVFSEQVLTLGPGAQVRTASINAMAAGRVLATISFGTDVDDRPARIPAGVGQAVFHRDGYRDAVA